jgi:hypothetical protein
MMSTTHAAMGAALTVPLAAGAPDLAPVAALGAFLGGLAPDLDAVVGEHRRTLHHPELYTALSVLAAGVALARPSPGTVAVAATVGGAALHSVTDVVGGGLAPRPWVADDDRGIYLHTRGRWVAPRRWIRYDGAPEDLVAAVVLTAPVAATYGGPVRTLALLGVAVSVLYTLLRRRLPAWVPDLFE